MTTHKAADFQGRVVVITGASRGLGLATACACAAHGARVVIGSRSAEGIERAVQQIRDAHGIATGVACDVGDLQAVETLAEHAVRTYGRFDVWINNAGYAAYYGATAHVPPAAFTRVVATNIVGAYNGTVVALRHLLPRGEGKLINVMGRGDRGPVPMQNAYAASKAWARSFTVAVSREYAESGIGIHLFSPGMMTTALLTDVVAVSGFEDRLNAMDTVIRMWATPPDRPAEDLAWLASPATDGRSGLDIREFGRWQMITGAFREGLRRLLRRPAEPIDLKISLVPAALPLAPPRRARRGTSRNR